jgi:two-component system response regulator
MKTGPILLIEDNEDDELLTLRAFRKTNVGTAVHVARDGQDGLDFLHGPDAGPRPALVLLDLHLPVIDGLEVLRRIRSDARTRTLPVVILTSSREQQDLLTGYDLGANSYVQKPVDLNGFIEATRQLGVYWLELNEPPPDTSGPVPRF